MLQGFTSALAQFSFLFFQCTDLLLSFKSDLVRGLTTFRFDLYLPVDEELSVLFIWKETKFTVSRLQMWLLSDLFFLFLDK